MKVLFMGTPKFAAVSLQKLISSEHEVLFCVTQPDRPKNRGQKLVFSDVKEIAITHNIPVLQPEIIKNGELKEALSLYSPDIIVVVAYGKLLPEYILSYPKFGCVNVHASVLPHLRGAAPINWSVINGDKVSGVTTMMMEKGLDTGDMLLTEKTEIGEEETATELYDRLSEIGAELLIKTLDGLEKGRITPVKQDDSLATYAPMLTKETGNIDFKRDAKEIVNLIRGLSEIPGAYTFLDGLKLKILKASKSERKFDGRPGEVLVSSPKEGLFVGCGDHEALEIKSLQLQGSKKMSASDFLCGKKILPGSFLG